VDADLAADLSSHTPWAKEGAALSRTATPLLQNVPDDAR
jgi:hypothetical protein